MAVDTTAVLDQLLNKVDEKSEAKILRIVEAFGVDQNDPMFLLLLANSSVQVLLEQAPNQLQQTLDYANQKALDKVEDYEQAAKRGVERQVAKAVNELVKKTGASKAQVTTKSIIGAGAIAFGLIGFGTFCGWAFSQWQQSQIAQDPAGPRQLTLNEAETLDWALSAEGQYARNLVSWNEDLLGGECQKQVEDLGVTIQIGSQQAKSGFCLVWTQPPSEREFYSAQ